MAKQVEILAELLAHHDNNPDSVKMNPDIR
jgi:hypothetical protein